MMLAQKRILFSLIALALQCSAGLLAAEESEHEGVSVIRHFGWTNSHVIAADGTNISAIIAPVVGGRIVSYGLNGQNILWENEEARGKTLATTKGWFWTGGYQCDIGPEIRGLPEHQQLFVGPYEVTRVADYRVDVRSQPHTGTGIQLEKQILMDPDTGALGLVQTMRNVSENTTRYCLWDRTLCKGGGFAFFRLNKNSRFKAGWSLRHQKDGKYFYDGDRPSHPNVRVKNGVLVALTTGAATKIGADSDGGWIAYALGNQLFVKYFPYFPGANYSDGGNSVELYFDDKVAELEPLSPEQELKRGESYDFPEQWILIPLKKPVQTHEEALKLVESIPPSPFSNLKGSYGKQSGSSNRGSNKRGK
jgi:hypothetical protein